MLLPNPSRSARNWLATIRLPYAGFTTSLKSAKGRLYERSQSISCRSGEDEILVVGFWNNKSSILPQGSVIRWFRPTLLNTLNFSQKFPRNSLTNHDPIDPIPRQINSLNFTSNQQSIKSKNNLITDDG
jgi:hypothetical protein